MQLKAPEGEENTSQAFHVIQVAQEREALKRRGDLLHAQIKKAETELEGLENTLVIINGGNERLRHKYESLNFLKLMTKFSACVNQVKTRQSTKNCRIWSAIGERCLKLSATRTGLSTNSKTICI